MEEISKDQFDALMANFITILDSYSPIQYGDKLNVVDAFFAYRLLLGRNPDATLELPAISSKPQTYRQFLTSLLNSREFYKTGGYFPPNGLLMAEVEGFRFWFNTSDREMGVLMALGLYEPKSVELIKSLVRSGMKCLDVGAQTGFFTCLMASRVGEAGKVHAFEPMPSSYKLLEKNIQENNFGDRVCLYQLAASNAAASLDGVKVSNMYVLGHVEGAEKVKIEAIRIDEVFEGAVDIIKIDVEGHEPAAIEGMKSLILRNKPIIISEANEYWLRSCSKSSTSEYVELLNSFGYDVYNVENLQEPITSSTLKVNLLDKIDIIALPTRTTPKSFLAL